MSVLIGRGLKWGFALVFVTFVRFLAPFVFFPLELILSSWLKRALYMKVLGTKFRLSTILPHTVTITF